MHAYIAYSALPSNHALVRTAQHSTTELLRQAQAAVGTSVIRAADETGVALSGYYRSIALHAKCQGRHYDD